MRLIFLVWIVLAVGTAGAQGKPEIKSVTPFGLRAGRTTTLTIYGENLAPNEIKAARPQITVKLLDAKPTEGEAKKMGGRQVRVEVTVPANAPKENVELTLTQPDKQKVTTPLVIVEDAPQESEAKKPNSAFAQAMPLPIGPVALLGSVEGDSPSLFRFEGKAGETWDFALLAGRGGSQLDAVLRVRNGRRVSLALAAGDPKKDRHLAFHIPTTGTYYVEVGDDQARGGPAFNYRLTVQHK